MSKHPPIFKMFPTTNKETFIKDLSDIENNSNQTYNISIQDKKKRIPSEVIIPNILLMLKNNPA